MPHEQQRTHAYVQIDQAVGGNCSSTQSCTVARTVTLLLLHSQILIAAAVVDFIIAASSGESFLRWV
jgi:hypothetical protein